ncbi:MAG: Hsp20/alpha crystallin family protein [bacterium]
MRRRRGEQSPLSLREEMNRLFDDFLAGWDRPLAASVPAELEREFIPSVDVNDQDGELKITAELPGMTEDDVNVEVDDDVVTISGEKKKEEEDEEGGRYWRESAYGSFVRQIPLPADADVDNVDAQLKNGRLTVKVPKTGEEKSRARRIDVKGE